MDQIKALNLIPLLFFMQIINTSLEKDTSEETENFDSMAKLLNILLNIRVLPRKYDSVRFTSSKAKPLIRSKAKGFRTTGSAFVDEKRVKVFGGNGGDGCVSMAHLCRNEFAGPDGGDGGNGGHVMFQATDEVNSLAHIPSIIKGKDGRKGSGGNCIGKSAEAVIVKVPFGTIFKDEKNEIVADLCSEEECIFLAARGGAGGKGNKFFATAENRGPEIAEYGGPGEECSYTVYVSTIAHVGLVGFPNAGKSTLLQAISRARPKVAPYPFTTLRPHVGMVLYDDYEQIAVADIPGLIEDAHKNRGLGISFLKHIERCVCLLYIIDMSSHDPFGQLQTLIKELEAYSADLVQKPSIIIANKIDLETAKDNYEEFVKEIPQDLPIVSISAKYGLNLTELLHQIRELYDQEIVKFNERKRDRQLKLKQARDVDPQLWKEGTLDLKVDS